MINNNQPFLAISIDQFLPLAISGGICLTLTDRNGPWGCHRSEFQAAFNPHGSDAVR